MIHPNEVRSTTQDLTRILEETKGKRLGQLWPNVEESIRVGWKIGSLQGLLFVLLVSTGMGVMVLDQLVWHNKNLLVQKTNLKVIGTRQEPRRINEHPGIVAAVLAPVADSMKSTVNDDELEALRSKFDRRLWDIPVPAIVRMDFYEPSIPRKTKVRLKRKSIIIELENNVSVLIPATEWAYNGSYATGVQGGAYELVLRDSVLKYFDELVRSERSLHEMKYEGVMRAFLSSQQFEYFRQCLRISAVPMNTKDDFPQVYYVAVNGMFSHKVDPYRHGLLNVTKSSPMYRWEASSYVQYFFGEVDGQDRYESSVYIDISGLGLVRTYSHAIFEKSFTTGIFCVDQAMDINSIIPGSILQEEYDNTGVTEWDNNVYSYRLHKVEKPLELVELQKVQKLTSIDGREYYQVPIQIGSDGADILEIRPYPFAGGVFRSRSMVVGIILILMSLPLFMSAISKTIIHKEQRGTASVLRSLPIGVLEMSESRNGVEEIIAANDHTEELFGAALRRFGNPMESRTSHQYYKEFLRLDGPVFELRADGGIVSVTYDYIMNKDRSLGQTSTYFTRLREYNEKWVRITGSPMIDPRSDVISTFGVIELVRVNELIRLLNTLEEKKLNIQ